jgi:SET domain-containing protein
VNTYVGSSPGRGRGVFAGKPFKPGGLIEVAAAIVIPSAEVRRWDGRGVMEHYTYDWDRGRHAIATGTALLYNHSDNPNVWFEIDTRSTTIAFTALRRIAVDEEMFIRYSDEPMLLTGKRAKRARGE